MSSELLQRTKVFAVNVVVFIRKIKISFTNKNILDQLLRSSTSVGANYQEASGSGTNNDFKHKINICRKESQETRYWIEVLSEFVNEEQKMELRILWKESDELSKIFGKISKA